MSDGTDAPGEPTPDVPIDNSPGPLSEMLIANAKVIDYCINSYGPSAVAEFFTNVGLSMAAVYDLHQDESGKFITAPEKEGK